jgi:hypothetical protein
MISVGPVPGKRPGARRSERRRVEDLGRKVKAATVQPPGKTLDTIIRRIHGHLRGRGGQRCHLPARLRAGAGCRGERASGVTRALPSYTGTDAAGAVRRHRLSELPDRASSRHPAPRMDRPRQHSIPSRPSSGRSPGPRARTSTAAGTCPPRPRPTRCSISTANICRIDCRRAEPQTQPTDAGRRAPSLHSAAPPARWASPCVGADAARAFHGALEAPARGRRAPRRAAAPRAAAARPAAGTPAPRLIVGRPGSPLRGPRGGAGGIMPSIGLRRVRAGISRKRLSLESA